MRFVPSRQRLRHPASRAQLTVEALEERLAPVIGANAIPAPVLPGGPFDGVVKLTMQGVGTCTGSLLPSGRHILTTARCITDTNGNFNSPSTDVLFQLPGKNITINVPQVNYWRHPGWNGNTAAGNDIAYLRLPALAPSGPAGSGAERYPLQTATNEIGQAFPIVGYGSTGTGLTGNSGAAGVKRAGQNTVTADASILRNEVQALTRVGNPVAGFFTLSFNGQTTAALGPNATAAQVQVALLALANIPAGAVNVEGGPALNTPYFVSFRGALANTNVSQLVVNNASLIGGFIVPTTRLQGATATPAAGALVYDFDNGQPRNDALGLLHGLPGLGQGANEGMQAPQERGAPAFLDGRIAGIASYMEAVNPGPPPDIDAIANGTFGELGIMTRVSSFAATINTHQNLPYALVLDMAFQHAGNNGGPDTVEVQRFGGLLRLRVNGHIIHQDSLTDINSITIRGSNDRDVITVSGDLAKQVTVQGSAGNDDLIVTGTTAADTATVLAQQVVLGPTTVAYSISVEFVRVQTGLGNDTILVQSTQASTPVTVEGGAGDDIYVAGSLGNSLSTLLGTLNIVDTANDADWLVLNDQGHPGARNYSLTATAVSGTNAPFFIGFNLIGTVEYLLLNAGSGGDLVTVHSTHAATATLLLTGAGSDTLRMLPGNIAGPVYADGEGGVNTLDYSDRASDVTVNFSLYAATDIAWGVVNFRNATGGSGNDILVGDNASNVLTGGLGRDILIAGGNDYVSFQPDTLIGGGGEDILIAGFTLYDYDAAALDAIRAEWAQPTDYWTRALNLYYGSGVPAFNEGTVFYNYAAGGNTLTGGGDSDWFLGTPGVDLTDWDGMTDWFLQIY